MIGKNEILSFASALSLTPNVIEKDYVLGWILAGINAHPVLSTSWAFKGGTCLKKCYFETYRFSEDLDFTLSEESHLTEDFLKEALSEVVEWVATESGLAMPKEQIGIDIYTNPRGKLSCQGKVGYRGPVSSTSGGWPKIKLDLTADERMVLPTVSREVFHPYSDRPADGIWSNCYAYAEAFAEKMRALAERTRPRDLYDVVNLYRHEEGRPLSSVLNNVLKQKCEHKSIPMPTLEALAPFREDLESKWKDMLEHQLPVLPPAGDFWNALPEIFAWIINGTQAPQRTILRPSASEIVIRTRVLPMAIPVRSRPALEIIRFGAANHLCIDLQYDGKSRRIEPYSLRQTAEGNFVLHAIRSDSGEHRSYRLDRIQSASVTSQAFAPRYVIELTPSGPLPVPESTAQPRVARTRTLKTSRVSGKSMVHIYRCPICKKTFQRKTMNGSLNQHKNARGYPCSGRMGVFVRTKY